MTKLATTWQLASEHKAPLLALVLLVYGPFYLLYAGSVGLGLLPEDAADKLFGLIGVLLMPIINGAVVWLTQHWYEGREASLSQALQAAVGFWSKLLTAYVSISFILLGWLAVTVLPAYVLMMILKLQQPLYLAPIAAAAGVWALSRYAFIDPLIVTAGLGPWQARQQSAALVKGRRRPVIAWALATYALPFILESAGEAATEFLPASEQALALSIGTASGLIASVLYVFPAIFFYVYYRELGDAEAVHPV